MRLLKLNSEIVDIDEKTAIGIDIQAYDIKQPGQRKIKISNNFSIPATAHNLKLLGFPGNPQSLETTYYNAVLCDYWIDNYHIIKNAKLRIEEVDERISLVMYEKKDFWDSIKEYDWYTFQTDLLQWFLDNGYIDSQSGYPNPNVYSVYVQTFAANTASPYEGLIIPFYRGNLAADATATEEEYNLVIEMYDGSATPIKNGGHFCVYIKTLFQFLEYKFGVNFAASGGIFLNNIFDDLYAKKVYTPVKDLYLALTDSSGSYGYAFGIDDTYTKLFPFNKRSCEGKTMYDFVSAFLQHFNIVIDELEVSGVEYIAMRRLDDLPATLNITDFSGGLEGKPVFKPIVESWKQLNYIKFKTLYENATDITNSKLIECKNKNIDKTGDLFTIDAYVNDLNLISAPLLNTINALKNFSFFIDSGIVFDPSPATYDIIARASDSAIAIANLAAMQIPAMYSLSGEYTLIEDALEYPKFYKVKKWLTVRDVLSLEFFREYWIKELNGSFFINKIEGFNPDKADEPTTLELLKISDRMPVTPPDIEYFIDGILDPFVDGTGDYFY